MFTEDFIREAAERYKDYTVQCRRTIHGFAETDGNEIRTGEFIRNVLQEENISWEFISKTGFAGLLDTGRPGPSIALRADMDALPMAEDPYNLKKKRVCMSETPDSTCHACGHDAHCAMLLSSIKALCEVKDSLCGKIYFIFEQGEEAAAEGAAGVTAFLGRTRIDVIWGIHVYAGLESGRISVEAGPRMSANINIDFTVHGKGGHGSRPDLAANPLSCAAAIINTWGTAWFNQITAGETVTLAPTAILGGSSWNIIPEEVNVLGTCRFFNADEGKKALGIIVKTAENVAEINKCTVKFKEKTLHPASRPVVNDKHYSEIAAEYIGRTMPGILSPCDRWFASETFGRYQEKVPGVFAFLGIQNEEKGTGAPHHNRKFDVDEDVMPLGIIATLSFVKGVMEEVR